MVKGDFKWILHGQLIEKALGRVMHLGKVSGRRAAFRSYLHLAPRVAAEVVKVCCGSQRRDPSVVLGWIVHHGLRSHLLVAPVCSGPCGGLCSGGLFMTALLFLFLCWDRSHQQDLMDEKGLKKRGRRAGSADVQLVLCPQLCVEDMGACGPLVLEMLGWL